MRRPLLFAAASLVPLASLMLTSSPFAGASTSPAALYRASLVAANHQKSLRYLVQSSEGSDVETTVGNAGNRIGTKVITIDEAGAVGRVKIDFVHKVVYLEGNEKGLVDLGFSATVAPKAANHWISIPTTDPGYAKISSGMSFASAVQQITMRPPFTYVKTLKRGGVNVEELHVTFGTTGTTPGDYYVQTAGNHLPEGYQLTEGTGATATLGVVKLSNWNEKVSVRAPSTSVPISTYGL